MTNEEIVDEIKQLIRKHTGCQWHTSEKAAYYLYDYLTAQTAELQKEVERLKGIIQRMEEDNKPDPWDDLGKNLSGQ